MNYISPLIFGNRGGSVPSEDYQPLQPSHGIDVEMTTIGHQNEPLDDTPAIHPGMCSITLQQLLDVANLAEQIFGIRAYPLKSMRDINDAIIIPQCKLSGVSYALSKNPQGLSVEAFITHCWDEPFADFVDSIRTAFCPFTLKPNLWICAFAIKQGDHQALEMQLDVPLREAPFVQALSCATWFVVVRNSRTDLYNRAWCVCGKPVVQLAMLPLIPYLDFDVF